MKTGDAVLHGPTGETWTVAYVQGDYIAWVGWPPGEARVADCTLVETCSEEDSIALIQRLAEMSGCDRDGYDARKSWALAELERRGLPRVPRSPVTEVVKEAIA